MKGFILYSLVLTVCPLLAFAQTKRHYKVEDNSEYERVHFNLISPSGSCSLRPTKSDDPINIYGQHPEVLPEPTFVSHIVDNYKYVKLGVKEKEKSGLASSLGFSFLSKDDDEQSSWRVFLAQNKVFNLNLNYGIGDADIDLSGIAVERLKISTGSADVNVDYQPGFMNLTTMDTFFVQVHFGSLNVKRAELAKAKSIIADVGFGNLTLAFEEEPEGRSDVTAYVAAGTLEVSLPDADIPVKVIINNSPLCRVKLTDDFTNITDNIYVNNAYKEGANNLLTFNLDVALGNIVFK